LANVSFFCPNLLVWLGGLELEIERINMAVYISHYITGFNGVNMDHGKSPCSACIALECR
jgi:hypothetical protein